MDYITFTVNLPKDVVEAIKKNAKDNDMSVTEATRRALSTQVWLDNKKKQGFKFLLERNGVYLETFF